MIRVEFERVLTVLGIMIVYQAMAMHCIVYLAPLTTIPRPIVSLSDSKIW